MNSLHFVEYGKENKEIILLLHGGGLSWWNYEEVANVLQKDYHIILPILHGHFESNKSFTTIKDNAIEIIDFIDMHFGGSVFMIGGLSLGGQILLEILSWRNDICKYAIVESALVIPSKLTYFMIRPTLESCYRLIRHRWFAKLQFKSLKIKDDLFEYYYRDTCAISKENMVAFLQENSRYSLKVSIKNCTAKVFVLVGEKENNTMQKSAKLIAQTIPNGLLYVVPGLYHGEFSINQGEVYVKKIRELITAIDGA